MAKRQFLTGAMIIAAGAVTSAANATQTVSKIFGLIDRATSQPLVSSVIRVDEDITALGGIRETGNFVTLASANASTSMEPIIVHPSGPTVMDTLIKPPPVPAGQDTVTKPPPVQGIRQDTLRPPVVPRVRRTVPKAPAPGGSNKP